jgi:hypothetical protein
MTGTGMFGND